MVYICDMLGSLLGGMLGLYSATLGGVFDSVELRHDIL